jgi:GT2 family glycosyltransferase
VHKPIVSIIIPTYNHYEDCLRPCVDSILKYTNLSKIEIIIVANGCTDQTIEGIKNLIPLWRLFDDKGQARDIIKLIVDSEPLGYTRATNIGILNSVGDYIVFLNNDTVLLDQPKNVWLDMLINPLINNANIGITGPHSLTDPATGYPFIVFFCACVSRALVNKIGVLNETFSPGGCEDIDFCIRLQKKGFKIGIVPEDRPGAFPIYHKGEATVHETEEIKKQYSINFSKNEEKLFYLHGRKK